RQGVEQGQEGRHRLLEDGVQPLHMRSDGGLDGLLRLSVLDMEVPFKQRYYRGIGGGLSIRQRRALQHQPALRVERLETLVYKTRLHNPPPPDHGHDLAMPRPRSFQGLAHAVESGLPSHKARQTTGYRGLETSMESTGSEQLVHLEGLAQALDRHWP